MRNRRTSVVPRFAALLPCAAASLVAAEVKPFSRAPFSAVLVEGGGGKVLEDREFMRSDGSWVGKEIVAGVTQFVAIHDVQSREQVSYDPLANAHYVLPLSKRELAKYTTQFASCGQATLGLGVCTEHADSMLGYSVDRAETQVGNGSGWRGWRPL